MGLLREGGHNTRFGPQWTSAHHDVIFVGIMVCFIVLWAGFLILLPSFKMNKSTLWFYIAVTFDLWLGWVMIGCNWAYEWQSSTVHVHDTLWAPYDPRRINATLGLHIGLRGFNITFVGNPRLQFGQIIDYNEQFLWSEARGQHAAWQQGRFGFGLFASTIAQKFHEWQFRGYPFIITELAEYFTLDGEDIRWYRWYRIAGWYSHIALWTCLPLWFLTNCLYVIKPSTGSLWLIFTGLCMELTVMIYGIVVEHNNKTPLKIPYHGGILDPEFNWSFYLVLFTGVMSIVAGICLYIYFMYHPDQDINLLTDPYQARLEEKPEPVQVNEENKIPPHRRAMSIYGGHTMRKRPAGAAPTEPAANTATRAALFNKALEAENAALAADKGDVELLPMDRMMSTSSRDPNIRVDESALANEIKRRVSDNTAEVNL